VYDHLLLFLTAASQLRHRDVSSAVMSGIVCWQNVTCSGLTLCGQQARLCGNFLLQRRDKPLALRLREALRRSLRHVRPSTVRLPRRDPPRCALSPGDWSLFSNNVTISVMPPRQPINTQEPSLCAYISRLTHRFALVALATGCPTQVCDAKIGMAWGQRGSSRPENPVGERTLSQK